MEYSKNLYKRKLLLLTGYSTRLKTLNIWAAIIQIPIFPGLELWRPICFDITIPQSNIT